MLKSKEGISNSQACNLCDSNDTEQIRTHDRHGNYLRSVICRSCGLVWIDPRPTPEQVREFYSHEYRLNYKGTFQPQPKHTYRAGKVAVDRFKRLKAYLESDFRILDVGAGSGEMVYVLREMGYDATGFEPNEGYASYAAQELKLPVTQGFWQNTTVPKGSQDMVTIFHAMEHMENPLDVLFCVRDWLRPQGLLVVEVPNVEAVCQQPQTQFHQGHLYHFNLATMEAMHRRAGYTVVSAKTSSDGGNIIVISRKNEIIPNESFKLPNNFECVASVLRNHTTMRHLFSRHPYVRPFRKLAMRLEEQKNVRSKRSAKQILNEIISATLL